MVPVSLQYSPELNFVMPIIKSARKRVKVARSANLRNFRTKRDMREAVKAFSKAVASGNLKQIADTAKVATSAIDKATKKDVIHANKAGRLKARLSAQAKAAGAKTAKTPAKAAPKKAAAKTAKTPAKAAAKAPVKKSAKK